MFRLVTHLDTLTPGMQAKLDPNFRLSTGRKPSYVMSVPKRDMDFNHSNPAAQSIIKQRSRVRI